MLQIKTFKLGDEKVNEWLEANYERIIMSKDGPEVKVFGHSEPQISIMYDKHGQGSTEYKTEGLKVELSILKQQLGDYEKQYLDHEAQKGIFPEYLPTRGKHAPEHSKGWLAHDEGMVTTKNQILLQKAKIAVVERLIANPDTSHVSETKKS